MAFETQIEVKAKPEHAENGALRLSATSDGWLALIAMAILMTIFQIAQGLNSDTSWLLTVCERWLGGSRLYVDILESNPPISVLSLWPAVALGRLTGLPPEAIIIAMTGLAAFVAVDITVRLSRAAGAVDSVARSRLGLGFAALVLPLSIFAEREHFAVIALLPMWAALAARGNGRSLSLAFVLVAGIGGGIAMCFKPQFALAILLPALGVARTQRQFAMLFVPEFWLASAIVLAYAAAVFVFLPDYLNTMVPLVMDLYRPIKEPLLVILTADQMVWTAVALIGLILVARGRLSDPAIALPLLAGLGCFVAVVEQSKGFAYHYYPMVAALVPAFAGRGLTLANERLMPSAAISTKLQAITGFLAIAVGLTFVTLSFYGISKPMIGLVQPIRQLVSRPKMLSISPHIWVGHPLTRDVGGTWVGSVPNQWMTLGALYKLGVSPRNDIERKRLIGIIDQDKARTRAEIETAHPDVIIVEHDDRVFPAWFGSDMDLAQFLAGYHQAADYVGVEAWVRDAATKTPGKRAGDDDVPKRG